MERNINFLHDNSVAKTVLCKVDFQRNFLNDTINFAIDHRAVFQNIILTSLNIIDFTQFEIFLFTKKKAYYVAYAGKDEKGKDFYHEIKLNEPIKKTFAVSLSINKVENKLFFDLNAGKFIGISKVTDNHVVFIQNDHVFYYD